ncbi:hypothetical protein [Shinella sp. M27]|uniref:hypothetical protein n=1 Tax=Shinella sp. M27 TaxID=3368614 RepID=UPI003B9FCFFE
MGFILGSFLSLACGGEMSGQKSMGIFASKCAVVFLVASGMFMEVGFAAMPSVPRDLTVSDPLDDLLVLASVNNGATDSIVKNIQLVKSECRNYAPAYRIDCLSQGLKQVASRIPGGEYDQARAILSRAASKLGSLVARNVDAEAEVIESKPNANPHFKAKRRYRAVKKAALGAVMKEAQAIVEEAVTRLMRSYENGDRRSVHYQKIAKATDSMKVLLRS